MARFNVGRGLNQYIAELERIYTNTPDMIGKSIYQGAKIVTDAVHAEIAMLPDSEVSADQRAGLLDGLGIAKMKSTMTGANVKVGMDGYNTHKTKKYPNGQPNMMIARALISGTSFHPKKNDFVRRAVNKSRAATENAMRQAFDEEIKKYT